MGWDRSRSGDVMAVPRLLAPSCVAFGVVLWLSWSWTPAPTAHYAASHTVPSTLRVRALPALSAAPSSRLRSRSHTPNGDLIPATAPPPATPSSSGSLLLLAPFAAAVGLLALALPRLLQSAGLDDTGPHPERAPMAAALLLSCALVTAPADALAAPSSTPAAVSPNASQDEWQSRLKGFRTLPKAPPPSASSSLFPGLPTFKLPTFPDLPTLPRPPTLPSLPSLPTLPSLPSLPSLPAGVADYFYYVAKDLETQCSTITRKNFLEI
jgi:hypothetical protein